MFRKNNPSSSEKDQNSWLLKSIKWIFRLPKSIFESKLSNNTGTKFLSLALAILFWFFVMDQVDPEITRVFENVPVQLTNTQELDQNSLEIMNQTDFFVDVEVTGRRNNVLSLNSKAIYLWADMRSVRSGLNNVFINSTINSDSVNIKAVLPKEIVLTVDRIVSLPKPVQIVFNDDFQESLYQESMEIKPLEIKVSGPESLVNAVSYLGGTISVNTLTNDYAREVSLVPYSFDGEVVSGVTLDINYATLNLKLGKTKFVPIETVVEGEPKAGYKIVSIKTTPEIISVSGEVSVMETLEKVVAGTIELTGDEETSFIVEKDVTLPEGIKTLSGDTKVQVEFVIEPIQTKEFTFDVSEIPVVNLNEKFTTDLKENQGIIMVKVTDIESVISGLTKNDIHLDINFSNVDVAGVYRMQINITDASKFNEIAIEPIYVDVVVIENGLTNP